METEQKYRCLFLGSTTLGDRGQVVIPVDARKELNLQPGDRLILIAHPFQEAIVLAKAESLERFLNEFIRGLSQVGERQVSKEAATNAPQA